MDFSNLKIFQMAMAKMDWASQRQKVLAQNVANADTPDYRERDLKALDFKTVLHETAPVNLARSSPKHSAGLVPQEERFKSQADRVTFEVSPDGNKVVLEEQMQKVGDTRADYNTAVTLIQAQMRMFKTVLSKGS